MKELKFLTKNELYELSEMIDRLDNEIHLQNKTMSDIRLSINECLYQRSYGRTCKTPVKIK